VTRYDLKLSDLIFEKEQDLGAGAGAGLRLR
jgi:hypothetical protein